MTIEQLEYILEISHFGSLSKAADHLFISQSALSMSLNSLEKELGMSLFERSKNGMIPTDNGRNILTFASTILADVTNLKNYAAQQRLHTHEDVRIIVGSMMYQTVMVDVISKMTKIDPKVFVHVLAIDVPVEVSSDLFEKEKCALIMWGENHVTPSPFRQTGIVFEPLYESWLSVYVKKDHPLLDANMPISIKDLCQYTMIATNALKRELEQAFRANLRSPIYPLDSFYKVEKLLINNDFVLLCQNIFSYDNPLIESGQIVEVPCVPLETNAAHLQYGIYYYRNHIFSPGEYKLLQCIRSTCSDLRKKIKQNNH